MKVIVSVSAGTDDPTRATLGMLAAKVAADQGHDVTVWLQGEAANIANRNVYPTMQGLNMPAMKGIVEELVAKQTPIWVCEACGKGRNAGPENFIQGAVYKGMGDYVQEALKSDKNLEF